MIKTKYILVGGDVKKAKDKGRSFYEELVRGFSEPVKILECLFARPEEQWQDGFKSDIEAFSGFFPDKKIEFKLATPENFLEQVKWANIIYMRGGKAIKFLKSTLKMLPKGWEQELNGKTIAGSSAGANTISKYYYGLGSLEAKEGLGLLPIKIIVHYKSDYNAPNINWNKAYEEMKNYKEDLELITLKEGEFKIIEK